MTDQIKLLEKEAKSLEPNAAERHEYRKAVVDHTELFLEQINDLDASPTYTISDKGIGLNSFEIRDQPYPLDELVKAVSDNVDKQGINPASGGHLGYIPGGGIYTSSLADYWVDITNRYAGVFFANPGAVRMENTVINWFANLFGYGDGAHGNLTSGGSIANLTAIIAAREAYQLNTQNITKKVVYLSNQAHHCITKAIHIAGLSQVNIRWIDLDEGYRLDPQHLERTIVEDINQELEPWMIIASAGTTDTGAIDPLNTLAEIAERYGLWYHIDAAYGGVFMLTQEGAEKLRGIERSDSLVVDPHKGLFIPYGIGVVLVKDREKLQQAFTFRANYMQDILSMMDEISPADVSPELTKHYRGLRIWLPFMIHGLKPFKACLSEKLLLAQYAYEKLREMPMVDIGPEPELSVVTFRFIPENGDANEFNQMLVQEIHRDGRVFVSSTKVNDTFILRLAILSFRTHLKTVDTALKIIQEKVTYLLKKK